MYRISTVFLLTFIACSTAHAEPRFTAVEAGDATIRIDRETGAITYCRETGGNLVCRAAADERKAWLTEMEALQTRIQKLEERLVKVEGGKTFELDPAEESALDKAVKTTETVMRRFLTMLKELRAENETTN